MTLLKVYNRNGYNNVLDKPVLGFNDLMRDFPFNDFFAPALYQSKPRANMIENKDSFRLEMEIPGIDKNLVKIDLTKDLITVSYNNEEVQSSENYTLREFNWISFERSFNLPESVNKEKIKASYRDGLLLIDMPKKEDSIDKGPRSIEIS
ncbi:MAG: Hsp20/alpha crystallin family protein [Bacteroidales bacterium]|nr:Hsp20/alpha crystallin family protein [Bacteroidales bacterium]MCB9013985.1 Hsp20/alpha crystallin family protein [Bacteroidales bacterium]